MTNLIDLPALRPPSEDGPRYTRIPIAFIRTDDRVNTRPLDKNAVKRIITNFDPLGIGALVVSKRSETDYVVLDGQHRLTALQALGFSDKGVMCEVMSGLTTPEEHRIFLRRNKRLAVRSIDSFLAAVGANEPTETAINSLVESLGLRVTSGQSAGCIACVSALKKIYSAKGGQGPAALKSCLAILTDAFGNMGSTFNGEVVEGVSLVLLSHPTVDRGALTRVLAQMPGGVDGLVGQARGLRGLLKMSVARCVAEYVVSSYNRNRRTSRLGSKSDD